MSDPYTCNTSNLSEVYIFKILNLNIPASSIHQCRNSLEHFRKRDLKGEGIITDGCWAWFTITALYETTNHTYSYLQVAFHKLSYIKFFDKSPYYATISVLFNKFISALREYEHTSRTPKALD